MEKEPNRKNAPGARADKPAGNTGSLSPADSLPASEESTGNDGQTTESGQPASHGQEDARAKNPPPGHLESRSVPPAPQLQGSVEENQAGGPEALLGWEDVLEN